MKTVSISWHAPCRTVVLFLPVFPLELRRHQQMTPKYRGISEGLDVRAQVPWCSQRALTQSCAHSRGIQKCGDNRLAPGQCLPGNIRLTSTRTYRGSASTHERAAKSRVALSPYGSSNANTKVRLKTFFPTGSPKPRYTGPMVVFCRMQNRRSALPSLTGPFQTSVSRPSV